MNAPLVNRLSPVQRRLSHFEGRAPTRVQKTALFSRSPLKVPFPTKRLVRGLLPTWVKLPRLKSMSDLPRLDYSDLIAGSANYEDGLARLQHALLNRSAFVLTGAIDMDLLQRAYREVEAVVMAAEAGLPLGSVKQSDLLFRKGFSGDTRDVVRWGLTHDVVSRLSQEGGAATFAINHQLGMIRHDLVLAAFHAGLLTQQGRYPGAVLFQHPVQAFAYLSRQNGGELLPAHTDNTRNFALLTPASISGLEIFISERFGAVSPREASQNKKGYWISGDIEDGILVMVGGSDRQSNKVHAMPLIHRVHNDMAPNSQIPRVTFVTTT